MMCLFQANNDPDFCLVLSDDSYSVPLKLITGQGESVSTWPMMRGPEPTVLVSALAPRLQSGRVPVQPWLQGDLSNLAPALEPKMWSCQALLALGATFPISSIPVSSTLPKKLNSTSMVSNCHRQREGSGDKISPDLNKQATCT